MRERGGRAWDEEASKENEYLSFPYYLHCLHVKVKHTFEKRKVERCNDLSLKLTKQAKIQGLTEKYGRNCMVFGREGRNKSQNYFSYIIYSIFFLANWETGRELISARRSGRSPCSDSGSDIFEPLAKKAAYPLQRPTSFVLYSVWYGLSFSWIWFP